MILPSVEMGGLGSKFNILVGNSKVPTLMQIPRCSERRPLIVTTCISSEE
jgi:hypothetical protein